MQRIEQGTSKRNKPFKSKFCLILQQLQLVQKELLSVRVCDQDIGPCVQCACDINIVQSSCKRCYHVNLHVAQCLLIESRNLGFGSSPNSDHAVTTLPMQTVELDIGEKASRSIKDYKETHSRVALVAAV